MPEQRPTRRAPWQPRFTLIELMLLTLVVSVIAAGVGYLVKYRRPVDNTPTTSSGAAPVSTSPSASGGKTPAPGPLGTASSRPKVSQGGGVRGFGWMVFLLIMLVGPLLLVIVVSVTYSLAGRLNRPRKQQRVNFDE